MYVVDDDLDVFCVCTLGFIYDECSLMNLRTSYFEKIAVCK